MRHRRDGSVIGCLGFAGRAALAALAAAVVVVLSLYVVGVGHPLVTMVPSPSSSAATGARAVPRIFFPSLYQLFLTIFQALVLGPFVSGGLGRLVCGNSSPKWFGR